MALFITKKLIEYPSRSEMEKLKKTGIEIRAASAAYDSITAAMQNNPLFVIALFLDIAGEFDIADSFYRAAGATQEYIGG